MSDKPTEFEVGGVRFIRAKWLPSGVDCVVMQPDWQGKRRITAWQENEIVFFADEPEPDE